MMTMWKSFSAAAWNTCSMARWFRKPAGWLTTLVAIATLAILGHPMADTADAAMTARGHVHINVTECTGCTTGGYIRQSLDSRDATFSNTSVVSNSTFMEVPTSPRSVHIVFVLLLSFLVTSPINPPIIV